MERSSEQARVALITGAARGIGRGIAEAFAAEGDAVVLADLKGPEVERTASEIGGATMGVAVDVRDAASVRAMVDAAIARFGKIDVLVNNAGIYPNTPVLEMDEAEWDAVFDTNVKGMFLVTQAVARTMVDRGIPGRIINISSGAGISGRVGASHYCSSKAAVNMFTRVLALEFGRYGITVNTISPGLIEVPDADLTPEYRDTIVNATPAGRIGQPVDIARGAVYLARPDSEFVTGSNLAIDGGSMAGRSLPLSSKRRAESGQA